MQNAMDNLAVFLDHVGDGVTVQDPTGRLVYANAAAAQALGFPSAAEFLAAPITEVIGRFALFDEDGQPFPVEDLPGRRALQGEPESAVTLRFRIRETGEERWSVIRSSPVTDAKGNVVYAVNVWQDATAHKRAEAAQRFLAEAGEALASSLDVEATLANIARLAVPRLADWCVVHLVQPDGSVSQLAVAHTDPERVDWARRLQEQYPADPDADQGVVRAVRTGRPELVPEVTDAMLVAAARDQEHLAMLRLVGLTSAMIVPMIARERSVGAISFAAAESRRRYDEQDLKLTQELARRAALAVDNARLYNAERVARLEAEEAQVRFRGLFEGVPDAILVVDAKGRFIEANTAACRMLGYDLDALLSMGLVNLFSSRDAAEAQIVRFQEPGEWRTESELLHRDGTPVPTEIWSRRLDLPTGAIGLSVVRDISAQREADQIREEVLTAISHDLRSPLNSIKLHAQSLQRLVRRGETPDPKRLDDGLTAIDTMSTRVASLLDDVVDMARDRSQQSIPFEPEPTDLVALAHRCAGEVRSTASRDVQVEATAETVVGLWDPRGIERVILNLLTNAIKYSPQGGAVVLQIERVADDATPHALLVVQDEGIGIPDADLPQIFERYRRGRNVGRIAGTGIGLTGAKQIVERHGGAIDVMSTEGAGTRVTVRLPLEPPTVD
ncbi:MAG TPA: ATP-binding protein [Thermomicrobiales bacterium]|nr:ATP-binding protein [Thermomicrobiales bacterium]